MQQEFTVASFQLRFMSQQIKAHSSAGVQVLPRMQKVRKAMRGCTRLRCWLQMDSRPPERDTPDTPLHQAVDPSSELNVT